MHYALEDEHRFVMYECSIQEEGDEAVIGSQHTGVFFAVPLEAVDVIRFIEQDLTAREIIDAYRDKYDEDLDLASFLEVLMENGLAGLKGAPRPETPPSSDNEAAALAQAPARYHFENISTAAARRFFSKKAWAIWWLLLVGAVTALSFIPEIRPTKMDLFFPENATANIMIVFLFGLFCVFLHEMAHLLAAKAKGVPSRLGFGHRLWMLVAETDMTGIWGIPKKERYLPFLAGPLLDIAVYATLVLALAGLNAIGFASESAVAQLLRASAYGTVLRIVWQCYFFVRTDFYYVFAHAFGCKSLMTDTKRYLAARVGTLWGKADTDLSDIPEKELKVVKYYSVIWLLGRLVAFYVLFFVVFPLMWSYIRLLRDHILSASVNLYAVIDTSLVFVAGFGFTIMGFFAWIKSIINRETESVQVKAT